MSKNPPDAAILLCKPNSELISVAPTTIKRVAEYIEKNGPTTARELADGIKISKGRFHIIIKDRWKHQIDLGKQAQYVVVVGGDRREGFIYGLGDYPDPSPNVRREIDFTDSAVIDEWRNRAISILRADPGNPFALMSLNSQRKRSR